MRNIRNPSSEIKGRPLTAQRRLLLKLIGDASEPIDAKQLYQRASSEDQSISLATVYRSLSLFKKLDLVDERRLGQVRCYYEMKQSPEHQHLICRGCGQVTEFEIPIIRQLLNQIQQEHSFNVTKAELYLEGYCQKCKPETK